LTEDSATSDKEQLVEFRSGTLLALLHNPVCTAMWSIFHKPVTPESALVLVERGLTTKAQRLFIHPVLTEDPGNKTGAYYMVKSHTRGFTTCTAGFVIFASQSGQEVPITRIVIASKVLDSLQELLNLLNTVEGVDGGISTLSPKDEVDFWVRNLRHRTEASTPAAGVF
jgi:hypothetical protein